MKPKKLTQIEAYAVVMRTAYVGPPLPSTRLRTKVGDRVRICMSGFKIVGDACVAFCPANLSDLSYRVLATTGGAPGCIHLRSIRAPGFKRITFWTRSWVRVP